MGSITSGYTLGPRGSWRGAIVILGMHRSGTSCLAGSLQQRGLWLGKVHEWNPYNLKGNRENQRIMSLNDEVLAWGGGSWDAPPACLSWNEAHILERNAILDDLAGDAKGPWGFKDPRTLVLLPFWLEALERPHFVGTYRHPARVAISLHSRSGMPVPAGVALWVEYNQRLLALHARAPFPLLSFDTPSMKYGQSLAAAARALGLTDPLAPGITPFFEDRLRSSPTDDLLNEVQVGDKALDVLTQLDAVREMLP